MAQLGRWLAWPTCLLPLEPSHARALEHAAARHRVFLCLHPHRFAGSCAGFSVVKLATEKDSGANFACKIMQLPDIGTKTTDAESTREDIFKVRAMYLAPLNSKRACREDTAAAGAPCREGPACRERQPPSAREHHIACDGSRERPADTWRQGRTANFGRCTRHPHVAAGPLVPP